jgi:hypothetical protein
VWVWELKSIGCHSNTPKIQGELEWEYWKETESKADAGDVMWINPHEL